MHRSWRTYLLWSTVFFALWLLLAGPGAWLAGLIASTLAAAIAVWVGLTVPPLRWRWLPSFLLFFTVELLLAGWDVARRALHPRLPLAPAWVSYRFRSTNPRVHLMLSAIVGLLPGTLSSHWDTEQMAVHALDEHSDWQSTIVRLEALLDKLIRP
ncbi:Na+/H+ antiporter subunit E [Gilvimarinus algae]|uniref:Na+/H+ antiporter subunit E n=1 Tax=Gilvimarinus algae TaxID=3058037 RepID=A0ABT8TI25_9GAMM|nr:Na+/H+ antiporter subunit E [Gilvimarinus sp. SDUM040014]MDO3383737.1 Na+/H+ antiporter subunit E [Gilvimarinus sp. SDUM040014]